MGNRRITFEHDGHRFEAAQSVDERTRSGDADPRFKWVVAMDGSRVLEFHGEYPYRDADVRKRVEEWYRIQKPVR
jgi:hypothetical protein